MPLQIREVRLRPSQSQGRTGILEFFPFGKARMYQAECLEEIASAVESGHARLVLEAPTGFGKSAVAVALARWLESLGKSSYIMVSSKLLQGQYLKDFSGSGKGTVIVKGRANFSCLSHKDLSCEAAHGMGRLNRCRHIPYPSRSEGKNFVGRSAARGDLKISQDVRVCPYWKQKCAAMQHPFPLFNYDYFLHETRYVGDFGRRDFLICDEAHNIESKLMRFIGFDISKKDLEYVGVKEIPEESSPARVWLASLAEWRDAFQEAIEKMEKKMGSLVPLELEKLEDLRGKAAKCDFLIAELDSDPNLWVVSVQVRFFKDRPYRSVSFKPIEVKKWGDYIFSMGEGFLLQSATIMDPKTLCDSLGLEGEILYLKIPSIFPEKSRLFHYRGVGSMSMRSKSTTLPLLVNEVEKLIQENPDEKGVVHTHTYSIMRAIASSLKSGRVICNESGFQRDETFARFKESTDPLVLITPSAYEGVDFKDDTCRWQALCKVPYPDLGDPQVSKRMQKDRAWYAWLTALRIVQTYGRGMRGPEDHCRTYILDSEFRRFYSANQRIFPEWFRSVVRW